MTYKTATWIKGKKKLTGTWTYVWSANCFSISLDSTDPITGQQRKIITYNDTPEWGKWKLVEDKNGNQK